MRSLRRRYSNAATPLAITLIAATALAQTTSAARDIIKNSKPLSPAEIVVVLSAVRAALAGKLYRLSYTPSGPGPQVLMASDGRPRMMRGESGHDSPAGHVDVVNITVYTGEPAARCGGTNLGGELVIEYEHTSTDDRWTASARTRTASEVLAPVFDMLTGVIPLESGSIARVGDHTARALTGPWRLPPGAIAGSPLQARMRQSLWIDTTSLLPVRWSLAIPIDAAAGTPAIPDYGMFFIYGVSAELRPPDGVAAPTCVP